MNKDITHFIKSNKVLLLKNEVFCVFDKN